MNENAVENNPFNPETEPDQYHKTNNFAQPQIEKGRELSKRLLHCSTYEEFVRIQEECDS
jgi:hypothetical protein